VLASENDTIQYLRVIKEGKKYYVLLRLTWRTEELYLATTRAKGEARKFHSFDRLIQYIETRFPSVDTVNLVLKVASESTKAVERRSALSPSFLPSGNEVAGRGKPQP
jgi:hypothetical protein